MTSKNTKKLPEFGRPLVPYFLENTDGNGEFVVNEDLSLPDTTEAKQKDLFIPNGERTFNVREFKDGYFEYKPQFLSTVMQGKEDALTLVDKDHSHFNANNKNFETFADVPPNFKSPKRRNSQKQGDYHYQNYELMMNKKSPKQQPPPSPPLNTPKKDLYKSNEYAKASSPPQAIKQPRKSKSDLQKEFNKNMAKSLDNDFTHTEQEPRLSTTAPLPALITPQFLLSSRPSPPRPSHDVSPSPPKDNGKYSPNMNAMEEPQDVVGQFDEEIAHYPPYYPSPPHPHLPPPFYMQHSPPMMPTMVMPAAPLPVTLPNPMPTQPPAKALTEQELLEGMSIPTKPQAFFAGGSITASPEPHMLPKPKFSK